MTGNRTGRRPARPDARPLERLLRPSAEVGAGEAPDALFFPVWLLLVIGIGRRHRALAVDGPAPTTTG